MTDITDPRPTLSAAGYDLTSPSESQRMALEADLNAEEKRVLLSKLPNVRIAGSTTATDTIFIEPTQARLPSNYSDLSYGHKAWTSRERPNNAPFTPAQGLAYTGNPADENAVRTWVETLFGG